MNYLQAVILGATIVTFLGLGIITYIEHLTIAGLRDKFQICLDQKSKADTENNQWKVSSEAQNNAIIKLNEAVNQREAEAKKASDDAKEQRDAAYKKAASILSMQVDPSDCVGAKQVLSGYLRSRK